MSTSHFSLEYIDSIYKTEQDWLFEKLLAKLKSQRHLLLTADQGWGINEYVNELGFQLTEKYPEFIACFMDLRPVHSSNSFLELFVSALLHRFPNETSGMEIDNLNSDVLRLSENIAKKNKIKIALFLANAHQFHRFKDKIPFLRKFKLYLLNQKNCVFCIYGNTNPNFTKLMRSPGPLSGLGQLFELKHNPQRHRSASIRKLFHDHKKRIGYTTSIHMSYMVDNHPFYIKLLAWHALMLTQSTCTMAIVEKSLSNLIYHFDHRFYQITESLTTKQLNFLNALADGIQKLYSRSTIDRYQLGSTGHVSRIKTSLENKEIIHCGRLEITFTDPIFKEWLRRSNFGKP